MNLLQLIEACETKTGWNDPGYRENWRLFLNEGIRTFASKYPWPGLEEYYQAVTNGTRYLVLPHFVDTIVSVLNRSTSSPVMREGEYDKFYPASQAQRSPGTIFSYDKIGTVPVLADPLGYVWIRPTDPTDAGYNLSVTGYVSNSGASGSPLDQTQQTISLINLPSSAYTLPALFTQIVAISKATDTNGDFFLFDAGANNRHISFLSRYESEASFKRLQFMYPPAATTQLEIRYRRKIPPLINNTQAPHPAVDPDFVIAQAIAAHYRSREDFTKAGLIDNRAREYLQDKANKEQNFDEPFQQIIPTVERRGAEYGFGGPW